MPFATQQQLDAATQYRRRMIADGYRYAWSTGTWTAPPEPAAPAEAHDENDHREESAEDFELFLTELKLAGERPHPRKLVHNARAQLAAVRKEQETLEWRERLLRADVAHEERDRFHCNVDRVAAEFINEDDYITE